MHVKFLYGREEIGIRVPDGSILYESVFPKKEMDDSELVLKSSREPIGTPPLIKLLEKRGRGKVAIAVSDITRPIPYSRFLPALLKEIESANVARQDIVIVIATGMHRPSTEPERMEMFGKDVAGIYEIVDHVADDESGLLELPGRSWSGGKVKINRCFAEAGFRIVTGLVEPHFMAGFSGGRKAVCPGLVSLETLTKFHGHEFLSNPRAANGSLEDNPCHQESLSIAKLAKVDFSVNVVLDNHRRLVRVFSGELEKSHLEACRFVSGCSCPEVAGEADIAITSCGGYPLDATFYQCVKGIVSCLPAVKKGGSIISFGSCLEGIGSPEYENTMEKYSGRWRQFLEDIGNPGIFIKDQWQMQMHCRALEKVGQDNLHFMTAGIPAGKLSSLSVNSSSDPRIGIQSAIQELIDSKFMEGMTVAVFPEGPYCAPRKGKSGASSRI